MLPCLSIPKVDVDILPSSSTTQSYHVHFSYNIEYRYFTGYCYLHRYSSIDMNNRISRNIQFSVIKIVDGNILKSINFQRTTTILF